ncbi:hypothetical protein JCM5350_000125 [Sporobolomyces pararoseus]
MQVEPSTDAQPARLNQTGSASPNPSSLNMSPPLETAPLVTIQLSCTVKAVHRLWSSSLSEQANVGRYGAATSIHGHEYTFHVTFKGPLCAKTGQIVALDLLEEILPLSVTEHISQKNLDADLSFFLSRPSTLENLCLFAWRNIQVITRPHQNLSVIKVEVESEPCRRNEYSMKLSKVKVSYEGEKVQIPAIP